MHGTACQLLVANSEPQRAATNRRKTADTMLVLVVMMVLVVVRVAVVIVVVWVVLTVMAVWRCWWGCEGGERPLPCWVAAQSVTR